MKLNCGWSEDITASDSCPWGLGLCRRTISRTEAQSLGSCSERWRFKFEDAMRAREHALDMKPPSSNSAGDDHTLHALQC